MSKLTSLIRRAPKRLTAVALTIAAAVVIPAAVFAWGPSRPTYTIEKPADHVTFDSITDNPNIGDERNFVSVRPVGSTGTWDDNETVQPGQEYQVRMYVHNNAASNLNLVAHDVTAKFNLPTTTGKSIDVFGYIDSSNASPTEVYDQATFNSSQDFNLAYVPNTLQYSNNYFGSTGVALPESIFTSTGAKLGYNKLDGNIPGCFQYAGYVYFTVKPQFAPTSSFTMSKEVSKHGTNTWSKSYAAQSGETVDYLLQYKNTGTAQQDDVTFRDTLPTGETYVTGSTTYGNALHPSGIKASDNVANGTGINVGDYSAGANAWVIFSATVPTNDQLTTCGPNTLVNSAKVTTEGGSISDTANVTVNKTCTTTPVYTCNALQAALVTGSEYKFTGNATATNGATITGYVFDFGDGNSTTGTSATATHTYALTGKTYTARMTVTFMVNGVAKTATSNACTVNVTVGQPMCTVPGKTNLPANDVNCVTPPPTTPPELPHTGPTETILGTIGLGAIVASLGYFISSRRALLRNR